jgi:hypothetical protein
VRDATQDEINSVAGMGFDPYLAGQALRMNGFDSNRTINMLLEGNHA